MPDDERAEILLLAGDSYRQLGNARAARAIYDRLLAAIPELAILAGRALPPSAQHVSVG